MQKPTSFNKLVVESYIKEGLRSEVKNGFAHLSQKIKSKGLRLLADATIAVGNQPVQIQAGSTIFIREEILHTAPWASKSQESDVFDVPFLVIDPIYVDYIIPPQAE